MTWPTQHPPGVAAVLLRDFPAEVVRIDCRYCERAGRYRLAALVQQFGPAAVLPEVLAALSADCPRRADWCITRPCGAGFPDLTEPLRWCRPLPTG
jgi:hypothetical protein